MRAQPPQSLSWRCGYCERSVQANYAHKCGEYDAALRRAQVNGDAGDAIDFALGHIEWPKEAVEFLDDWRADRADKWPGYVRWLTVQREGVAASGMSAGTAETRSGSGLQPASPAPKGGDAHD